MTEGRNIYKDAFNKETVNPTSESRTDDDHVVNHDSNENQEPALCIIEDMCKSRWMPFLPSTGGECKGGINVQELRKIISKVFEERRERVVGAECSQANRENKIKEIDKPSQKDSRALYHPRQRRTDVSKSRNPEAFKTHHRQPNTSSFRDRRKVGRDPRLGDWNPRDKRTNYGKDVPKYLIRRRRICEAVTFMLIKWKDYHSNSKKQYHRKDPRHRKDPYPHRKSLQLENLPILLVRKGFKSSALSNDFQEVKLICRHLECTCDLDAKSLLEQHNMGEINTTGGYYMVDTLYSYLSDDNEEPYSPEDDIVPLDVQVSPLHTPPPSDLDEDTDNAEMLESTRELEKMLDNKEYRRQYIALLCEKLGVTKSDTLNLRALIAVFGKLFKVPVEVMQVLMKARKLRIDHVERHKDEEKSTVGKSTHIKVNISTNDSVNRPTVSGIQTTRLVSQGKVLKTAMNSKYSKRYVRNKSQLRVADRKSTETERPLSIEQKTDKIQVQSQSENDTLECTKSNNLSKVSTPSQTCDVNELYFENFLQIKSQLKFVPRQVWHVQYEVEEESLRHSKSSKETEIKSELDTEKLACRNSKLANPINADTEIQFRKKDGTGVKNLAELCHLEVQKEPVTTAEPLKIAGEISKTIKAETDKVEIVENLIKSDIEIHTEIKTSSINVPHVETVCNVRGENSIKSDVESHNEVNNSGSTPEVEVLDMKSDIQIHSEIKDHCGSTPEVEMAEFSTKSSIKIHSEIRDSPTEGISPNAAQIELAEKSTKSDKETKSHFASQIEINCKDRYKVAEEEKISCATEVPVQNPSEADVDQENVLEGEPPQFDDVDIERDNLATTDMGIDNLSSEEAQEIFVTFHPSYIYIMTTADFLQYVTRNPNADYVILPNLVIVGSPSIINYVVGNNSPHVEPQNSSHFANTEDLIQTGNSVQENLESLNSSAPEKCEARKYFGHIERSVDAAKTNDTSITMEEDIGILNILDMEVTVETSPEMNLQLLNSIKTAYDTLSTADIRKEHSYSRLQFDSEPEASESPKMHTHSKNLLIENADLENDEQINSDNTAMQIDSDTIVLQKVDSNNAKENIQKKTNSLDEHADFENDSKQHSSKSADFEDNSDSENISLKEVDSNNVEEQFVQIRSPNQVDLENKTKQHAKPTDFQDHSNSEIIALKEVGSSNVEEQSVRIHSPNHADLENESKQYAKPTDFQDHLDPENVLEEEQLSNCSKWKVFRSDTKKHVNLESSIEYSNNMEPEEDSEIPPRNKSVPGNNCECGSTSLCCTEKTKLSDNFNENFEPQKSSQSIGSFVSSERNPCSKQITMPKSHFQVHLAPEKIDEQNDGIRNAAEKNTDPEGLTNQYRSSGIFIKKCVENVTKNMVDAKGILDMEQCTLSYENKLEEFVNSHGLSDKNKDTLNNIEEIMELQDLQDSSNCQNGTVENSQEFSKYLEPSQNCFKMTEFSRNLPHSDKNLAEFVDMDNCSMGRVDEISDEMNNDFSISCSNNISESNPISQALNETKFLSYDDVKSQNRQRNGQSVHDTERDSDFSDRMTSTSKCDIVSIESCKIVYENYSPGKKACIIPLVDMESDSELEELEVVSQIPTESSNDEEHETNVCHISRTRSEFHRSDEMSSKSQSSYNESSYLIKIIKEEPMSPTPEENISENHAEEPIHSSSLDIGTIKTFDGITIKPEPCSPRPEKNESEMANDIYFSVIQSESARRKLENIKKLFGLVNIEYQDITENDYAFTDELEEAGLVCLWRPSRDSRQSNNMGEIENTSEMQLYCNNDTFSARYSDFGNEDGFVKGKNETESNTSRHRTSKRKRKKRKRHRTKSDKTLSEDSENVSEQLNKSTLKNRQRDTAHSNNTVKTRWMDEMTSSLDETEIFSKNLDGGNNASHYTEEPSEIGRGDMSDLETVVETENLNHSSFNTRSPRRYKNRSQYREEFGRIPSYERNENSICLKDINETKELNGTLSDLNATRISPEYSESRNVSESTKEWNLVESTKDQGIINWGSNSIGDKKTANLLESGAFLLENPISESFDKDLNNVRPTQKEVTSVKTIGEGDITETRYHLSGIEFFNEDSNCEDQTKCIQSDFEKNKLPAQEQSILHPKTKGEPTVNEYILDALAHEDSLASKYPAELFNAIRDSQQETKCTIYDKKEKENKTKLNSYDAQTLLEYSPKSPSKHVLEDLDYISSTQKIVSLRQKNVFEKDENIEDNDVEITTEVSKYKEPAAFMENHFHKKSAINNQSMDTNPESSYKENSIGSDSFLNENVPLNFFDIMSNYDSFGVKSNKDKTCLKRINEKEVNRNVSDLNDFLFTSNTKSKDTVRSTENWSTLNSNYVGVKEIINTVESGVSSKLFYEDLGNGQSTQTQVTSMKSKTIREGEMVKTRSDLYQELIFNEDSHCQDKIEYPQNDFWNMHLNTERFRSRPKVDAKSSPPRDILSLAFDKCSKELSNQIESKESQQGSKHLSHYDKTKAKEETKLNSNVVQLHSKYSTTKTQDKYGSETLSYTSSTQKKISKIAIEKDKNESKLDIDYLEISGGDSNFKNPTKCAAEESNQVKSVIKKQSRLHEKSKNEDSVLRRDPDKHSTLDHIESNQNNSRLTDINEYSNSKDITKGVKANLMISKTVEKLITEGTLYVGGSSEGENVTESDAFSTGNTLSRTLTNSSLNKMKGRNEEQRSIGSKGINERISETVLIPSDKDLGPSTSSTAENSKEKWNGKKYSILSRVSSSKSKEDSTHEKSNRREQGKLCFESTSSSENLNKSQSHKGHEKLISGSPTKCSMEEIKTHSTLKKLTNSKPTNEAVVTESNTDVETPPAFAVPLTRSTTKFVERSNNLVGTESNSNIYEALPNEVPPSIAITEDLTAKKDSVLSQTTDEKEKSTSVSIISFENLIFKDTTKYPKESNQEKQKKRKSTRSKSIKATKKSNSLSEEVGNLFQESVCTEEMSTENHNSFSTKKNVTDKSYPYNSQISSNFGGDENWSSELYSVPVLSPNNSDASGFRPVIKLKIKKKVTPPLAQDDEVTKIKDTKSDQIQSKESPSMADITKLTQRCCVKLTKIDAAWSPKIVASPRIEENEITPDPVLSRNANKVRISDREKSSSKNATSRRETVNETTNEVHDLMPKLSNKRCGELNELKSKKRKHENFRNSVNDCKIKRSSRADSDKSEFTYGSFKEVVRSAAGEEEAGNEISPHLASSFQTKYSGELESKNFTESGPKAETGRFNSNDTEILSVVSKSKDTIECTADKKETVNETILISPRKSNRSKETINIGDNKRDSDIILQSKDTTKYSSKVNELKSKNTKESIICSISLCETKKINKSISDSEDTDATSHVSSIAKSTENEEQNAISLQKVVSSVPLKYADKVDELKSKNGRESSESKSKNRNESSRLKSKNIKESSELKMNDKGNYELKTKKVKENIASSGSILESKNAAISKLDLDAIATSYHASDLKSITKHVAHKEAVNKTRAENLLTEVLSKHTSKLKYPKTKENTNKGHVSKSPPNKYHEDLKKQKSNKSKDKTSRSFTAHQRKRISSESESDSDISRIISDNSHSTTKAHSRYSAKQNRSESKKIKERMTQSVRTSETKETTELSPESTNETTSASYLFKESTSFRVHAKHRGEEINPVPKKRKKSSESVGDRMIENSPGSNEIFKSDENNSNSPTKSEAESKEVPMTKIPKRKLDLLELTDLKKYLLKAPKEAHEKNNGRSGENLNKS